MTTIDGAAATRGPRAVLVATVAAVLLLGGACSRGTTSRSLPAATMDDAGAAVAKTSDAGPAAAKAASNEGPEAAAAGAVVPAELGRDKVVKTASIDIEVGKGGFAAAFSKVPTIASANGGFVASSDSFQAGDGGRQSAGTLVLRVPAENFDRTREQLIGLGKLQSQHLEGSSVGGQLTDLEARLRNLRSHEEAIRLLMTKTGTIGETIEVQRQLSTVREQIEKLAGEQARLMDAVAYATLTLSLAEPGVKPPGDHGSPLATALTRAVDGAENVLAALIIALGYLIPLGILGGLSWMAAKPAVARRRNPLASSPPAG